MYEAKNYKELKMFLEQGKSPIIIRDKDTIKVVKTLESLKHKGLTTTVKDKIAEWVIGIATPTMNVVSETTVVVLGIITATSLIALYALYKEKNIKLKFNRDGSVELETHQILSNYSKTMANELTKLSNFEITPSNLKQALAIASSVGEKLGEALSDFIDKCYGVDNKK